MKLWISATLVVFAFALGFVLGMNRSPPTTPIEHTAATRGVRESQAHLSVGSGQRSRIKLRDKDTNKAITVHEQALSKVAALKGFGLSDMMSLGISEDQREQLSGVVAVSLERLKVIELRWGKPVRVATGEQGIEIKPFPEDYASWRAQLVADVEDVLAPAESLVAIAAIENELGHGAGFALETRRVWTAIHPESPNTYILRTQFLDQEGNPTTGWTQTRRGGGAPERYDHFFTSAE